MAKFKTMSRKDSHTLFIVIIDIAFYKRTLICLDIRAVYPLIGGANVSGKTKTHKNNNNLRIPNLLLEIFRILYEHICIISSSINIGRFNGNTNDERSSKLCSCTAI